MDRAGHPAAYFYLDPYSRPAEKRGGAWMDDVQGRSRALAPPGTAVRLPVAHMVCNQSPPVGATPSLMTFREVRPLPLLPPPLPPPPLLPLWQRLRCAPRSLRGSREPCAVGPCEGAVPV